MVDGVGGRHGRLRVQVGLRLGRHTAVLSRESAGIALHFFLFLGWLVPFWWALQIIASVN